MCLIVITKNIYKEIGLEKEMKRRRSRKETKKTRKQEKLEYEIKSVGKQIAFLL